MSDIDSDKELYSGGNNDECYTPDYAVKPILEYIPKDVTVWCPFDTEESEFVKQISKTNPVTYSHLDKGQDFFQYQPKHWDIIVSNPPFSNKKKFFKRALSFNKPFALIMTNAWLNDSAPKKLFKDAGKDLQLLMFEERMEFKYGNAESLPIYGDKVIASKLYVSKKVFAYILEVFPISPLLASAIFKIFLGI